MLFVRTRKKADARQNSGVFWPWNLHNSKGKTTVLSETEEEDDVELTLDEQIEAIKRHQILIRQLAAEQGVFLKEENEGER